MPKKKRIWYPGAMFHVMSRGNRRTAIFKDDSDYVDFLEYLGKVKETFGFKLHAVCLMTNHFHMSIETQDKESIEWSAVKLAFYYALTQRGKVIDCPEALGDICGASYIYPLLYRFGIIDVPDAVAQKMQIRGGAHRNTDKML